jgi:signal transduction histidine kinase
VKQSAQGTHHVVATGPYARWAMPEPVRRSLLVIIAAAMVLVAVASVWGKAVSPSDGTRAGYVTSTLNRDGLEVLPLAGATTPIEAGDRVVEIEGIALERWLAGGGDGAAPIEARIGDSLSYVVEREEARIALEVPLTEYPLAAAFAESWGTLLFIVLTFAVGLYVYVRQPAEPAAGVLLLVGSALTGGSVPWLLGFQALDLATGPGFWIWIAGSLVVYSLFWSTLLHFALVFPNRIAAVERWRGVVPAVYLAPLLVVGGTMLAGTAATGSVLEGLGLATLPQLILVIGINLALIATITLRYRRTREPQRRQQVRWIAWGGGMAAGIGVIGWFGPALLTGDPIVPWSAIGLSGVVFPIAVAIAVLRHRLFDIDVVINRSLVYGGLTVAILAVYVAAAALIGSVLRAEGAFATSLLATGVAALAALPVRDRLQLAINRLMYGDRDDPYRAIARLGEQLSASLATEEVLPTVVATVAGALRLPYVAIELGSDEVTTIAAATGEPPDAGLERLELIDRGERIGELIVAPRSRGESFSEADRRLLAGLAHEAGRAARSVRLVAELERSSRQLVAAREDERRRLRRDLHDGLGPSIAGARLKVEAASARATVDPVASVRLLGELDSDLAGLLEEVRRLSRGLRPPALDELGLLPALRAQGARVAAGHEGLDLRVEGPDSLPTLPAAVEAAAYWIALEALTNALRHGAATRCDVRIRLGDALEVEVEDDGVGFAPGTPSGVGLTAMRERAREVGGSFEIGRRNGVPGTRVVARLPLPAGGMA